jgi:hypothetical protein
MQIPRQVEECPAQGGRSRIAAYDVKGSRLLLLAPFGGFDPADQPLLATLIVETFT